MDDVSFIFPRFTVHLLLGSCSSLLSPSRMKFFYLQEIATKGHTLLLNRLIGSISFVFGHTFLKVDPEVM